MMLEKLDGMVKCIFANGSRSWIKSDRFDSGIDWFLVEYLVLGNQFVLIVLGWSWVGQDEKRSWRG